MMQPTYRYSRRAARAILIAVSMGVASAAWPALPGATIPLAAQSVGDLLTAGDRESLARRPLAALASYEKAVLADPRSSVALWKAAREAVDAGEFEKNDRLRTSLYTRATDYARRAVAMSPRDAEAHFHLSRAVGRTALAANPREKVKYALEVRDEALKALQLEPRHPGALHVLGVWNAEIMRLNGFMRAVARTFLGGPVLSGASWPEAIRYLEQAVSIEPNRLVHQLDLARVYRDAGRPNDARVAYQAALRAPLYDANDDVYRTSADEELKRLR
jgi:tetratricopeptide (TPR) repeat protein